MKEREASRRRKCNCKIGTHWGSSHATTASLSPVTAPCQNRYQRKSHQVITLRPFVFRPQNSLNFRRHRCPRCSLIFALPCMRRGRFGDTNLFRGLSAPELFTLLSESLAQGTPGASASASASASAGQGQWQCAGARGPPSLHNCRKRRLMLRAAHPNCSTEMK